MNDQCSWPLRLIIEREVKQGEEGEVEAFWDMFEPGEMPCRDIDSVIG